MYYVHKSCLEYEITELELELQAEIDKFLLLKLLTEGQNIETWRILDLLFENYALHDKLTNKQKERYKTASNLARKYCYDLSKNLNKNELPKVLKEIRQFYPLTQEQKIRHILQ